MADSPRRSGDGASSAADPGSGLSKMSICLDGASDVFRESVRVLGRASQPRVDATRSAVVRLAVMKLARDLSPAEVIEELRRSAPSNGTARPGRPRR